MTHRQKVEAIALATVTGNRLCYYNFMFIKDMQKHVGEYPDHRKEQIDALYKKIIQNNGK